MRAEIGTAYERKQNLFDPAQPGDTVVYAKNLNSHGSHRAAEEYEINSASGLGSDNSRPVKDHSHFQP